MGNVPANAPIHGAPLQNHPPPALVSAVASASAPPASAVARTSNGNNRHGSTSASAAPSPPATVTTPIPGTQHSASTATGVVAAAKNGAAKEASAIDTAVAIAPGGQTAEVTIEHLPSRNTQSAIAAIDVRGVTVLGGENESKKVHRCTTPIFAEALKHAKSLKVAKKADMTIEKLPLEYLPKVMAELQKFEGIDNDQMLYGLSFLKHFTSSAKYGNKIATKWSEELAKNDYVGLVAKLWPSFWAPTSVLLSKHITGEREQHFRNLLEILANGTGCCPAMCVRVCDHGLVGNAVDLLKRPEMSVEALKEPSKMATSAYRVIMDILHGCMIHCSERSKQQLRSAGGVSILSNLMSIDNPLLKANTAILLAHSLDEKEDEQLLAANDKKQMEDVVEYLVERLLKPSLENESHRVRTELSDSSTTEDILLALNSLAMHDASKPRIGQLGTFESCHKVMQKPKSQNELANAVRSLWLLTFNEKNRQKLHDMLELTKALETLTWHKTDRISHAACGALWNLYGKNRGGKVKSIQLNKKGSIAHIMISYDWQHQTIAKRLNQELKDAGYQTWMDLDRMKGSTLDAMAEAVEKAAAVIICLSEQYKNSPSCRQEAEYASKLQKETIPVKVQKDYSPDGWLGLLVGAKLYFDCTDVEKVPTTMPDLVKALGNKGKELEPSSAAVSTPAIIPGQSTTTTIAATAASNHTTATSSQSMRRHSEVATTSSIHENHGIVQDPKPTARKISIDSWSANDVEQWLKQKGLQKLTQNFKDIDGPLLIELCNMFQRAPTVFYKRARHDLGVLSLVDLLKLTKSLEGLIHTKQTVV